MLFLFYYNKTLLIFIKRLYVHRDFRGHLKEDNIWEVSLMENDLSMQVWVIEEERWVVKALSERESRTSQHFNIVEKRVLHFVNDVIKFHCLPEGSGWNNFTDKFNDDSVILFNREAALVSEIYANSEF